MADKSYYIMLVNSPWAGPTVEVVSGPDIMVNDGVMIGEVNQPFEMKLIVDKQAENPSDFPPCDIHGPTRSLLFSARLIECLNKLSVDNIEYIDANVIYEPTGESVDYKVANVVGIVSGLDLEQSEVVLSRKGKVLEIEKMCLDEEKLKGHKMVRLRESIMHIVVHKSIKEAVEAASLTGFMFLSDDEFEPGMI
jgi:hypothetical protein